MNQTLHWLSALTDEKQTVEVRHLDGTKLIFKWFKTVFSLREGLICVTKLTLFDSPNVQTHQLFICGLQSCIFSTVCAKCILVRSSLCCKYPFIVSLCKLSTFVCSKDFKSICFIWRLNVLISMTQASVIQLQNKSAECCSKITNVSFVQICTKPLIA